MLTRSVMITGCSKGLGLEMVCQLVTSDDPPEIVIGTCRNPDAAKELQALAAQHKRLKIIKFDVVAYSELPRVVAEVKAAVGPAGLNLLVNNAGIMEKCSSEMFGIPLPSLTPDNINSVMNTNVTAPLMIVKELLPLLLAAAGGDGQMGVRRAAVINISSTLGSMADFMGDAGIYGYRASKTALNMLTKSLASQYGGEGLLFVAVHPGWVQTDMGTSAALLTPRESVDKILGLLPTLTENQNGLFVSYDGSLLKW